MSVLVIRSLLETALAAMTPAVSTSFENVPFTPVVGTPYQRAHLMFAEPDAIEMGNTHHREQGIFQITLCYPLDAGPSAAVTRAEAIRKVFYRGRTLVGSGISLTIERHPEIAPAITEDDRFVLPVRVRFFANITRS